MPYIYSNARLARVRRKASQQRSKALWRALREPVDLSPQEAEADAVAHWQAVEALRFAMLTNRYDQ
jgi:hypothetical protein